MEEDEAVLIFEHPQQQPQLHVLPEDSAFAYTTTRPLHRFTTQRKIYKIVRLVSITRQQATKGRGSSYHQRSGYILESSSRLRQHPLHALTTYF